MACQAPHVTPHRIKVHVGHSFLGTELAHHWGNQWIMAVADSGKQVVLDLIIEPTVEKAQKRPADVAATGNLAIQKGPSAVVPSVLVEGFDSIKVVRDDEEERDKKGGR